jgi:hypothetical protein
MNDRLQATAERELLRQLRKRVRAIWLLTPLVLGGLMVWAPLHADGQVFGINPIDNISVLVGTPISIPISVTNTTTGTSVLFWSLTGNPTTASISPTNTDPQGTTTFSWTPTAAQVVTFTVAVSQFDTINFAATSFTVTVTNSTTAGTPPYLALPFSTATNITLGTTLTFTAFATNTDGSANALTFSLDPVAAAAGATITTINSTSGLFQWTPTVGGHYDNVQVIVTEAVTSLSATQAFSVDVLLTNNCAQLDQFLAAVQHGGYFMLSNCTTIVLTNTLTISNNVVLDAGTNSVTISGNNLVRLFTVLPGVTNFTLNGLTVSGGQDPNGGGIYISPGAMVVLTNCTFTGNLATGANGAAGAVGSSGGVNGGNGGNGTGGGSAFGGAIYNLGSLTALGCQFLTNSASGGSGGAGGGGGNGSGTLSSGGNGGGGGGGGPGDGGAIYSAGNLSLSNCTFLGNSVSGGTGGAGGTNGTGRFAGSAGTGGAGMEGSGAAVYSANYAVILGCTFSGNVGQGGDSAPGGTDSNGNGVSGAPGANSLGGGLYSVNTGFLTNCTFYNNQVTGGNGGGGGSGTSTLASGGNGGNGGNGLGGGLYNGGSVFVVNCTFYGCGGVGGTNGLAGTGRFAGNNGSIGVGAGGDIAQGSGSLFLANSILATNAAGGNAYDTSASRITDGGYNISSDGTPSLSGTSLNNTDPQLSTTLANNGGLTLTLGFLTNTSPAIDQIPPSAGPATDQRGIPRPQPQGGLSDIGAYELVTLPGILTQPQGQTIAQGSNATFTVVALGDSLTYQWQFNGTNISDATLSAYTVSGGQATNTGNYDVVLANNYGSVTSLTALLVVYPFTISGQVFDVTGTNGLSGVTVSAGTNSVLTDGNGNFILSGFSSNAYTVIPSLACYLFGPSNVTVSVGPTNALGVNFFATNDYHSVSGAIANGPAGVTVTVTGTNGTVTVTSSAGVYGVSNLCAGFYFVVPSLAGYQFQPPTNSILVPPDAAAVNFTAVQVFGISGSVTQGTNGPGLGAISVAISGPTATNVATSASGAYLAGNLPPGTYVVTPTAPGCYHLNLPARTVTLGPNNANGTDFVVLRDAYTISGHLTNGVAGVGGITVSAGGTNSAVTDATGLYVISNLCAGSYTVAPSASCYLINPTSLPATVGPGNASGLDFSASPDAYTISGRITEGGIGVAGVPVQAGNQTTNTDASGNYVLSGLCPGSYSVIPSQGCRLFNPASVPVALGPNASGVNFITYSNNLSRIRGQVTDGAQGLSNVQVTATGAGTNITDASGNYVLSDLCPGTYVVTPLLSNYCFNTQSVTVGSAQTTNGVDFVATPGTYQISGTLRGMTPGPAVSVSIVGANTTNVVTTTNGTYTFPNLCPGTYFVTPSSACYQFYPPSSSTTVGPNDDGLDFELAGGSAFSIRGQVTLGGVGLSNVTVSAAGQTYVTGADGNYAFSYVCAGVYPVTASSPNFQFEPATNTVTLSAADANGVNFAAIALFSLSGQVLQGANGLPGVKVTAGTNTTFTDASGYYTNHGLRAGANVLVTPSLGGYAFAPAAQSLTLNSDTSGLNFLAFPSLAITFATNGSARLAYAAAFTCGVQASTDLQSWQTVFATNSISTDTLILQLTDTNAAAFPMRFYRLGATFGGPPVLTDWTATNHAVTLDGVAGPILDCQIEVSTDLKSWTRISTNSLLTNSVPLQFRYAGTNNAPVQFYRLFQTPGF